MLGLIYIITNTINNKVYIGQTIQTLEERWVGHTRKGYSPNERNMHIKRAILKYGKENFTIAKIEECPVELLDERERFYIQYYDSYYTGYNSTFGGKGTQKLCKLSSEKMSLCIELYKEGFSLRDIAKEFNVDKQTIKHMLKTNNISLRTTRTYKFSTEDRKKILDDVQHFSRKEVMKKWNISKSYLSQLINGERRI